MIPNIGKLKEQFMWALLEMQLNGSSSIELELTKQECNHLLELINKDRPLNRPPIHKRPKGKVLREDFRG